MSDRPSGNDQAASAVLTDSPYSWMRLAICVMAGAISSVGLWAAVLVLPEVQAEFSVARGDASIAYSAAMAGFALGNLWLGRLVDRLGIFPILLGAALLHSASFGLGSIAPNMLTFTLLQFLAGLGTAAGFGPLITDISHWFLRYRGIAVAATAAGNYIAGTIWPLALKDVIAADGWRSAFMIISVVVACVLVPLAFALRRRFPHDDHAAAGMHAGGATKSIPLSSRMLVALLFIAGIGCCMAMAMPQVHIVAYCVDLGFGSGIGAEMLSLMLATGIISRLASGFLADRIGGVPTLLIGSVLQCLALFLYLPFDGLMSLYVVSAVFGLAQGGIVPSYAIIVREYLPAREAGKWFGYVMFATVAGMALGGWSSGYIYDLTGSYQAAFIHGIGWNLLNIAIMVFILMRSRPSRNHPQTEAAPA